MTRKVGILGKQHEKREGTMKIKTEEGRKLFIRVISDKKVAKLDFSGAVKEGMEADALKKQVCLALSKKGKAYGVYEEQKLLLL